MELKSLSSNWKKLQGSLQKKDTVSPSTSTKRKTSEREPQKNAVKKRRAEVKEDTKKSDRPRPTTKRKRMSDGGENRGENEVKNSTAKSTSRRNSTATVTVPEEKGSHIAKPNEGRSPRLVFCSSLQIFFFLTSPKCGTRHLCSDGLRNGGSWSQP